MSDQAGLFPTIVVLIILVPSIYGTQVEGFSSKVLSFCEFTGSPAITKKNMFGNISKPANLSAS